MVLTKSFTAKHRFDHAIFLPSHLSGILEDTSVYRLTNHCRSSPEHLAQLRDPALFASELFLSTSPSLRALCDVCSSYANLIAQRYHKLLELARYELLLGSVNLRQHRTLAVIRAIKPTE